MLESEAPAPTKRPIEYLEDALALAERDLRVNVGSSFQAVAQVAMDLVEYRVGIVAAAPEAWVPPQINSADGLLTQVAAEYTRANALQLSRDPEQWPPWIRYAVELVLMEESIDRVQLFADRYADLRALLVDRQVPEPISEPLREVVRLHLWGFDGPAIAMASIAFERLAKQTLVALGHASEAQLQRERRGAEELRVDLVSAGLLDGRVDDLRVLIQHRNALLHGQDLTEALDTVSKRWIATLILVMEMLHPSWPMPSQ